MLIKLCAGVTTLTILAAAGSVSAKPTDGPRHGPSFSKPVVVTSEDSGEPGLDIGKDGTLYINAPSTLLNATLTPSYLFASKDGVKWNETPPGVRAGFPGGGDSDLAIDPTDGTIYFTDLWLGSSTVSASSDGGETWVSNPFGGMLVHDRQWLAASGNGVVYHAYNQIPGGLFVSKSIAGSTAAYPFHSLSATVLDRTGCICPPGNLIAEGGDGPFGTNDKVGVIYSTSTGGVRFSRSTNGALTFSTVDITPASNANTMKNFPIVVDAGKDRLYAVWLEIEDNVTSLGFSSSRDWGETWAAPRRLPLDGTPVFPWIDARGSEIALSLFHTSARGVPARMTESAAWYESVMFSEDGGKTFDGPVRVDPVPVKTGPICTEGTACGSDRELLDYQVVALDKRGIAHFTWTRSIDGISDTEIRYARRLP